MQSIGLWTKQHWALAKQLPLSLRQQYRFVEPCLAAQLLAVEELSLLALAPEIDNQQAAALPPCQLLLLPETAHTLLSHYRPQSAVVSYGNAHKNSLTLSANAPERACVSLLREIPHLQGGIWERQEIPLSVPHLCPLDLLFQVGLLLILGISPEMLQTHLSL